MAKKNPVEEIVEAIDSVEEVPIEKQTETVFIPKTKANSRGQFVGVNGETWRVPTGKTTEVPAHVASVLRQSEKVKAAIVDDKITHSK